MINNRGMLVWVPALAGTTPGMIMRMPYHAFGLRLARLLRDGNGPSFNLHGG
jgi:YD repeat-containing protein